MKDSGDDHFKKAKSRQALNKHRLNVALARALGAKATAAEARANEKKYGQASDVLEGSGDQSPKKIVARAMNNREKINSSRTKPKVGTEWDDELSDFIARAEAAAEVNAAEFIAEARAINARRQQWLERLSAYRKRV